MVTPRLKSINCLADENTLLLSRDPRSRVELDDPEGQTRALLVLLAEGIAHAGELRTALAERWPSIELSEINDALDVLDGLGWLEDAAAPRHLTRRQRQRHFSNLAFFDAFTTLDRGREEIQRELLDAHVVVLGAGGLGSSVIQNLAAWACRS